MKKYLAFALTTLTLSSHSIYASSVIKLSAQNEIQPNSEINLALDELTKDVPFIVSCDLTANSPSKLDMKFTPVLAPNGGFGVVKINDVEISQDMGALQAGKNKLSFLASIANNTEKKNRINFKNLDTRYTVGVSNCEAVPATNVTTLANKLTGGYFYVINHLPYFVDISVGNYIPTNYCIGPYSRLYVQTSTYNQNIDIIGTHY